MTLPGALHSDHVNYLILRYLQEHGHEESAKAFFRDWHRPREFRDPESLPFARAVSRYELVSVIQDGLRHDELQARVARADRRFRWSVIDPRQIPEGAREDVGVNGSRPSSSKRKSLGFGGLRQDDGAPAVKRPRIDAHINGHRDAMDIDRSSSVDGNEDDADVVSPAVASEGQGDAVVMRYDSVATQTEMANGHKPPNALRAHSVILGIDKQPSKIMHVAWSPNERQKNTLFATGESLCRMIQTPDHIDGDVLPVEHMDEPAVSEACMVTAMTWHPNGQILTCAVDTIATSQEGKQMNTRRLISVKPGSSGTYTHFPDSELLHPPGVALAVQYSPSGDYLLVARTNINRGLIEIWPALSSQPEHVPRTQPIAWKICEHSLSDVAWISDRRIMACTHTDRAWILEMTTTLEPKPKFTAESMASHNLAEETITLPSRGEVDTIYKHDDTHSIDIFFVRPYDAEPLQDQMIVYDSVHYGTDAFLKSQKSFDLHWTFVTAAMQPARSTRNPEAIVNYGPSRFLATIYETGGCRMYELDRDNSTIICKPLFQGDGYTFKLSEGKASAVAWSPDGAYIAVAGLALVQVWHVPEHIKDLDNRPAMTWRAEKSFSNEIGHINGTDRDQSRPVCLTWDSQSKKICFAVENKIALIECEKIVETEAVTNGIQPA